MKNLLWNRSRMNDFESGSLFLLQTFLEIFFANFSLFVTLCWSATKKERRLYPSPLLLRRTAEGWTRFMTLSWITSLEMVRTVIKKYYFNSQNKLAYSCLGCVSKEIKAMARADKQRFGAVASFRQCIAKLKLRCLILLLARLVKEFFTWPGSLGIFWLSQTHPSIFLPISIFCIPLMNYNIF